MEERIQKLLAGAGICSRRRAEEYITAGRVTVNGRPAQLGDKALIGRDTLCLDGQPVALQAEPVRQTYLLYKPRGYVTTLSDERGRRTVSDLMVGVSERLWPVGRLDLSSEGLLLMTNDGALTQRLLHPSHEVEKEYLCWVEGDVAAALPILRAPITLDGEKLAPISLRVLRTEAGGGLLSITIREGKNRQVRRMCAAADLHVTRLKRIREGGLLLDKSLQPGQFRMLTEAELRMLQG